MPPRLNLAALTGEELEALLGPGQTQRLLPDISAARLATRPYPGPTLPEALTFEALQERDWGGTQDVTRRLRALRADLDAAGAVPLGVYYVPALPEARHQSAHLDHQDTAVAVRWSETPEGQEGAPFLQAVSLLRDRASGIAAVLTSTSPMPFAPTLSEEVDGAQLPTLGAAEFLAAHRARSARHGRAVKLSTEADWQRAWQALRALNLSAWQRRGLVIDGA
ncbi:hypothetical protein [Deinococcus maricopensis]|uniref:Uncharacterized protein n=1 Tax=Deinococcus maricopensis (strain DSM 21211 / LMG 22137 / NRRL B-23946 / LB-34) TaxID=709986 RepID=E8UAZ1_DEIML|nr:hypothetical protein [Deinococcus maricopensis]ADV68230.1 hypothetical protein Deima_2597 [Deinococcus maricopensis DSM 21211]